MKKEYLFIAMSIVLSILLISSANVINLSQIQAFAQTTSNNNINSFPTIHTKDIVNMTTPGQKVVLRGMASSSDYKGIGFKPSDTPTSVQILPNKPDGTIYTGIVTFTATKPVEVGISHRLPIDNSTFAQIDTKTFGNLFVGYHHDKGEAGTPGELGTASVLVPDYGTKSPYFSASIPFVGDSLWLRSSDGEPFVAVYSVSADIVKPLIVSDLQSAINLTKTANSSSTNTSP